MGIVTKTGDKGTTGTLGGQRLLKSSSLIELNGQIDEVNASLGYLNALIEEGKNFPKKEEVLDFIRYIQNGLYNLGTEISSGFTIIRFDESHALLLESKIDELTSLMPPQTKFILFSGAKEATYTHVVRSVSRRCERQFVRFLLEENIDPFPHCYKFLNRLSDYLFTLARFLNQELGGQEMETTPWITEK
ncbi:MAG TPA: cob(I)yrinic acid a,c-diamide adenosyltransferase [Clostridiaceae bacterium]|nr:cob(I)yrinic acid a,c-diamide adenosyltransferase [Clostridiaceae bacterium]